MAVSFSASRGDYSVTITAESSSEKAAGALGLLSHRLATVLDEYRDEGVGAQAVAEELGKIERRLKQERHALTGKGNSFRVPAAPPSTFNFHKNKQRVIPQFGWRIQKLTYCSRSHDHFLHSRKLECWIPAFLLCQGYGGQVAGMTRKFWICCLSEVGEILKTKLGLNELI